MFNEIDHLEIFVSRCCTKIFCLDEQRTRDTFILSSNHLPVYLRTLITNRKLERKHEGIIICFIWFYSILNTCKRHTILHLHGHTHI